MSAVATVAFVIATTTVATAFVPQVVFAAARAEYIGMASRCTTLVADVLFACAQINCTRVRKINIDGQTSGVAIYGTYVRASVNIYVGSEADGEWAFK